jgi:hypothetical protein
MDIHLRYERAIELMRRGSVLVETHVREHGHLKTIWSVHPGGDVTDHVAHRLQEHRHISPNDDGAWPGLNQTWRFANGQ